MKTLRYIWLILAFSFLQGLANAQTVNLQKMNVVTIPTEVSKAFENFRYLTVNDGFSRNSVFQILQDEKGYMWFGLWDGLYRYDGNELQHIVTTSKDKALDQAPNSLVSDGTGNIWVGSTKGIFIWDDAHKQKHPFTTKTETGDSISGYVGQLHKDKFNNIWIINQNNKLFIYNLQQKKLKHLSNLDKNPISRFNQIYIDKTGNIWLATNGNGVLKLKSNDSQTSINPFDHSNWEITTDSIFDSLSNSSIWNIFQDSESNYWVGTTSGIFRIDQSGEYRLPQIFHYENNPKQLSHIKVNNFTEYNNTVFAVTNQGLFTYNLRSERATWNLPNYIEENHLNDKSLTDICIDKEKGIWISSFYGGVNYVHPTNTNFSLYEDLNKYIEGHVISAITEDKNGNIWMSVEDNGVCLWNRKTNTIQNFNNSSDTRYKPTFSNVQGIFADGDYVYVGMFQGGMDIVNINTLEHINLNSKNTSPKRLSNYVYSFHKYKKDQLLIGTIDGLYRFNTQTHSVHKIKDVKGKINCIAEDEKGDLWVSSLYKGFYWYSQSKNKWWNFHQDSMDSVATIGNTCSTILPLNSSIYIGTQGNGLWVFNKQDHSFQQIATNTLKDAIIFKILQHREMLWITTNQGLFAYNLTTQHTKQYTVRDGLGSNQFKENSGIITSDGIFMFGGLNGFNCFRPANMRNNETRPTVMLTDFYLFNRSADIHDPECPLKKAITYTDKLDLNQKHHSFAFKFSSSSYCDPIKNKFEYKLEPFEKEWQRTHGRSKLASYTNIPAGTYVFHVRTSNGQGIWSDERCIKVTIHPYWWLSWPMKIIYTLIMAFIILHFILRYRNKKKKEMHLFRMEKEQEVYESKMQFFTCMVHEIRTPLTLILGPLNSTMNKQEHKIKDVLPDLKIIERNGQRLLSLVNQLMDFRKVEEKSYTIQISTINIKELILQCAKDFRYYNIQKSVSFEYDIPQTECWAQIDREAFTKVLTNLLSNAMKFTKDHITVSLKLSKDGAYWEMGVRDNGNGIPEKEQTSIFESFYQIHQDLPGDYVGTGIGLFVVRRLMLIQKGDIRVESKVGEGATFIATIPFAEAPVKELEPQQQTEEQQTCCETTNTTDVSTSQKKHLLIAEDNEEMRNYIASLFEDKYETETFENGKEALEATKHTNYDIIVTDLMMPVMDGITLCRTLKHQATTCHIPIIILTAKDDETSQKEGFESEADMYVTKPFSAEVLQSRVKSILRNREHLSHKFYSEPETTAEVLYTNDADKEFLQKLDEIISQRLSDCNLPVDELAAEMAMGRSVFYQKVKGVTGLTPNDYIRTLRLKKAVSLFQKGETRINEVCYRVGFSSPSYFTKRFTLQFGISPSDYLKKGVLGNLSD